MISSAVRPGLAATSSALAASLLCAGPALAHIDLKQPLPREVGSSREPNSDLKQRPCGQVSNGRTSRVSVFSPGETIEVTWEETIDHRSYYRVAFDRDGDDAFPTFAGPGRGAQRIDPRASCPVDGQVILAYDLDDGARGSHTLRVTLPDVECERCTLQVVQYMFDTNNPYYFQCADLALRRPPAADAGAPDPARDAGLADAGREPRAAPGCSARIAPLDAGRASPPRDDADDVTAPPPAASASPPVVERPAPDASSTPARSGRSRSGGGCALEASPRGARRAGGAWAALVAAAWQSARRRARSRRGRAAEALGRRVSADMQAPSRDG